MLCLRYWWYRSSEFPSFPSFPSPSVCVSLSAVVVVVVVVSCMCARSSVDATFADTPAAPAAPTLALAHVTQPTADTASSTSVQVDPSSQVVLQVVVSNPTKVETFLDEHTTYTVSGTLSVDRVSHPVNVVRRYNHFLYLHERLKVLHPNPGSLPSFPRKRIFDRLVECLLALLNEW
jgi:PX domain